MFDYFYWSTVQGMVAWNRAGPFLARVGGDQKRGVRQLEIPAERAKKTGMSQPSKRISARHLNKEWRVNASHALYHHKGAWYHVLNRFPAALFDPQGYVRFETEAEYLQAPQLQRGAHLHVPGGIRNLPGYRLGRVVATPLAMDLNPPDRASSTVYRILRDTELAKRVKAKRGHVCQLCGFKLTLTDGTPYIEAHHVKPLGAPHHGPDIEENILCVCPNHHAALDYGTIRLESAMLAGLAGNSLGHEFIDYHNQHVFGQRLRRRNADGNPAVMKRHFRPRPSRADLEVLG